MGTTCGFRRQIRTSVSVQAEIGQDQVGMIGLVRPVVRDSLCSKFVDWVRVVAQASRGIEVFVIACVDLDSC